MRKLNIFIVVLFIMMGFSAISSMDYKEEENNIKLVRCPQPGEKAGTYFSNDTELSHGGISLNKIKRSDSISSTGGESPSSVHDLFKEQEKMEEGKPEEQRKRNHLTLKVFAVLKDDEKQKKEVIENDVFISNETEQKLADFVSSSITNKNLLKMLKQAGYEPCYDDHLGLKTLEKNPHLFFNLIKNENPAYIRALGVECDSSQDLCDNCCKKLYEQDFMHSIESYANSQKYDLPYECPFLKIFYAGVPCYCNTTYSFEYKEGTTTFITESSNVLVEKDSYCLKLPEEIKNSFSYQQSFMPQKSDLGGKNQNIIHIYDPVFDTLPKQVDDLLHFKMLN
ncbi:MAG: hypothetical protein ACTSXG_01270 [Alphaproteobacteria bacterium]